MKIYGTLIQWNSGRGEGLISTPKYQEEILVYASSFPQDGVPPRVGEALLFEVVTGPDGKHLADKVQRPSLNNKTQYSSISYNSSGYGILFILVIVVIVSYQVFKPSKDISTSEIQTPQSSQKSVSVRQTAFSCDGRTHCSHMTSCEEASYFLKNCPNTKMDGDSDGIPCESQWCR